MVTILLVTTAAIAQKDSTKVVPKMPPPAPAKVDKPKKDWSKFDFSKRPNDHFMITLGYDNWVGKPDTISTKGIGRSFGFYFMLDFPFKTDPHFSVGAGLGISSSSHLFQQTICKPDLAQPDVAVYGPVGRRTL